MAEKKKLKGEITLVISGAPKTKKERIK
jgi:hypothetical protein